MDTSRDVWFCQFCGSKVVLDNRAGSGNTFHSDIVNINYNAPPSEEREKQVKSYYDCEIYRDPHLNGITKVYVKIDGTALGELTAGKCIRQQLSYGEHELSLMMWGFPEFVKKFDVTRDTRVVIDRMGTWKVQMVTRFESL